mgnify:CR=1 FL=1
MMTAIRRPGSEYTRSLMNETQAQIDNFPDGMIGFTEMHEAGIQLDHMTTAYEDRAYELYRGGAEIYILYGNLENPQRVEQVLVETENEIFGYDGIFGITETRMGSTRKKEKYSATKQEALERQSAEKD